MSRFRLGPNHIDDVTRIRGVGRTARRTFTSPLGRVGLVSVLMLLVAAMPVVAQEDDEDLPDIAPREVEIRGELQLSFPELERQPLMGFNPPPRVPELHEDRRPYVAPYKQSAADLPSQDDASADGGTRTFAEQHPTDVVVEAGGGRYMTRFGDLQAFVPVSPHEHLDVSVSYLGTDGHAPYDQRPEAESADDRLDGHVAATTRRGEFEATVTGGGFYRQHSLFNAVDDPAVSPAPQDFPPRTGAGGFGSVAAAGTASGVDVDGALRYAETRYRTDYFGDGNVRPNAEHFERRFTGEARLGIPLGRARLGLEGDFSTAGLGGNEATEGDNVYGAASSTVAWRPGRALSLTVGARLLSASVSEAAGRDDAATYLAPVVKLDFHAGRRLHFVVANRPAIEPHTLRDLFEYNPYLEREAGGSPFMRMEPSIRYIDGEAGLRAYLGSVRVAFTTGYEQQANRLFVLPQRQPVFGYAADPADVVDSEDDETFAFFRTAYDPSRTVKASAEITWFAAERLQATLGATARSARLTDLDAAVPFVPPLEGHATVSYHFAGRGLLQLNGAVYAPAYVDLDEDVQTPAYVDVDLLTRYRITGGFGLVLRIDNIGATGPEWWNGYPEPPLVPMLGLRYDW